MSQQETEVVRPNRASRKTGEFSEFELEAKKKTRRRGV